MVDTMKGAPNTGHDYVWRNALCLVQIFFPFDHRADLMDAGEGRHSPLWTLWRTPCFPDRARMSKGDCCQLTASKGP